MIKIVIGMGFGDEGKGFYTDYLCSESKNPLVVRFSGGHQVGHTVIQENGTKHVFSNFGSGTFRGAPTYWSPFCTVSPISLMNELDVLLSKGVEPKLFIDENCPITTPFDIQKNRLSEDINQHGSVGVGFGSTIKREENFYSLTFIDLYYPEILKAKLNAIADYYRYSVIDGDSIDKFLNACEEIVRSRYIKKVIEFPTVGENIIFEGSQGLLLDQHYGFFPNVTRANIGGKNAFKILNENFLIQQNSDIEFHLITRAYQTRHGNGFMTNEHIPHKIIKNPDETNIENQYQGKFRISLLDVSLLEYALHKDNYIKNAQNKTLVITCSDHIKDDIRFTYEGKTIKCLNIEDFTDKVSSILNIKNVFLS